MTRYQEPTPAQVAAATLTVHIVIPGEPQGKARHRTGQGRTYTPKKTTDKEALIRSLVVDSYPRLIPMSLPVKVDIAAYVAIPQAFSKLRRRAAEAGTLVPDKKPDKDNIEKLIFDAIQFPKKMPPMKRHFALQGGLGYVVHDDSQVLDGSYSKRFCNASFPEPCVLVTIAAIPGVMGAYRK